MCSVKGQCKLVVSAAVCGMGSSTYAVLVQYLCIILMRSGIML